MRSRFQILVVEDDNDLRNAVCEGMRDFNFDPVEAASGTDALAVIAGSQPVDALFTDIRLGPGPDGWDVAVAFREAHPDKPVIYASAFAPGEWRRVSHSLFFSKPYRVEKVAAALQVLVFPSSDSELHGAHDQIGGSQLVSLTYMSRPTGEAHLPNFDATTAHLEMQSQSLNQISGLTGALIVHPEFFIQILEGKAQPLFATLARITRDPRHRDIRIFNITGVRERLFGKWDMHVGTVKNVDLDLISSCIDAFRHPGPLGGKVLIDALLQSTREAS